MKKYFSNILILYCLIFIFLSMCSATAVTINITSPLNNANSYDNYLDINCSVQSGSNCWYSNDTLSKNITITCGQNITNIIWSVGQHNLTIWANDSTGAETFARVTFNITPQLSSSILYQLTPLKTYLGYSEKFKLSIDRAKLNIGNNLSYSAVFDITDKDGISLCGNDVCRLKQGQSIKKAGYNISIESLNTTSATFKVDASTKVLDKWDTLNLSAYTLTFEGVESNWSNEKTIKTYVWDFGNKEIKKTSIPEANYTYNKTGTYTLKIIAEDSGGINHTGVFSVSVESPKNFVNTLLAQKSKSLQNLSAKIDLVFPVSYGSLIKEDLGFDEMEIDLADIQKKQAVANKDEDFVVLLNDLLELEIPEQIAPTLEINNAPYYVDKSKIDSQALESVTGETYSTSEAEQYANNIASWNIKNVAMRVTYKELSYLQGNEVYPLLNIFELNVKEIKPSSAENYLLIKDLGNMNFAGVQPTEKAGYFLIPFSSSQSIVFSTTEGTAFDDFFAVVVSEDITKMDVYNLGNVSEAKTGKIWGLSKWVFFVIILMLLIGIGAVSYIAMKLWYKRKYENYLFKNRNDLLNLVNFTKNSKNKGLKEDEIKTKLKKSGWTGEQITYVLKKIKWGEKK